MKTNYTIEPNLIDNDPDFKDDFFQRFQLRHADEPLQLTDSISKNYKFPTFYKDVTCAIAIFFCDYKAAQAIMPHPSMKPVKGTLGRAIVIFSCYEYKQVLNIKGYNEIAMTIPVMVGGGFSPPLLPLVMKNFKKTGYYVFSMPVTSQENQLRGLKIWGLPKVTEEIDINIENDICSTVAKDEQGETYFELKVPTKGKIQHLDETGYLYSLKEGHLIRSQTNFQGKFHINKNFSPILKKNAGKDEGWLKLGHSQRGETLKKLKIESKPFQFRYCPNMNSCFDLPFH